MAVHDVSLGEILAIEQDHKGFMWFGGRNGLARFDGYRFHVYRPNKDIAGTLSHNVIRDIFEDSFNELWIASEGGGLMRLNRRLDNFQTYRHQRNDMSTVSSNVVSRVYEDLARNLWVVGSGGGISLYNRKSDSFTRYLSDSILADQLITDILQISGEHYLISTLSNGLYLWERDSKVLRHFLAGDGQEGSLAHDNVRKLFKDSKKRIWVGSDDGLSQFVVEEKRFVTVTPPDFESVGSPPIWDIREGEDGVLWLSSDGAGLIYYYPDRDEFGFYAKQASAPNGLSCHVVREVFLDDNNDLWVGCFPGGVDFYNRGNTLFETHRDVAKSTTGALDIGVWSFSEDAERNIWLGSDGAGLFYFDRVNNTISKNYQGKDFKSLALPKAVLSIYKDKQGNLWLGSWGEGVVRFNPRTMSSQQFVRGGEQQGGFAGLSVWRIVEDKYNNLWFATMDNGVIRYDAGTQTFSNYTFKQDDSSSIAHMNTWNVYSSKDKDIWIATSAGISRYLYDKDAFENFQYKAGEPHSISHNLATEFFEDSRGNFWVGTRGGGLNLFDRETNQFSSISSNEGLGSDIVLGIAEDSSGGLWISSESGITRYSPEDITFRHYTEKNWLQDDIFYQGSYLKLSSGEMIFGGVNGFSLFNPDVSESQHNFPSIYFTDITIYNSNTIPGAEDSLLEVDILETTSITLPHNRRDFTITYSALNYRDYEGTRYRFKLQGFDRHWRPITADNSATYTNINPGKYRFMVKATNSRGVWGDNVAEIEIIVEPSLYKTWWAYGIYLCIMLLIICGYFNYQRRKLQTEHKLNEQLKALDNWKDELLANTSHELRTPLNGIIGIAEILRSEECGEQSDQALKYLDTIIGSAQRLTKLINDILDYSKASQAELKLNPQFHDFYELLYAAVQLIRPSLSSGEVQLENYVSETVGFVYVDSDRTEQILINLLGNAVKYTEKGLIAIRAYRKDKSLEIQISDTGIGIAEDDLKRVFDAFEQVADSGVLVKNGTGLGLAITQKLIRLQGGEIRVQSKVGEGTVFTVTFPVSPPETIGSNTIPPRTPDVVEGSSSIAQSAKLKPSGQIESESSIDTNTNQEDSESARIIVVSDQIPGERSLLKILNKQFNAELCLPNNLGKYLREEPDGINLVVLFVANMDLSRSMSKRIRYDYKSSDLPILDVTPFCEPVEIIASLKNGANDIISDNYDKEELLARVRNLLDLQSLAALPENEEDSTAAQDDNRDKSKVPAELDRWLVHDDTEPSTLFKNIPEYMLPCYIGHNYSGDRAQKTVLIVDDEEVNRTVLRHMMLKNNFNVLEAVNGPQALAAMMSGTQFDLVILDIMLPAFSGYEVCRNIRTLYDKRELPVFFLSARSQPADVVRGFEAGGNDFIFKPIKKDLLYAKIEASLRR